MDISFQPGDPVLDLMGSQGSNGTLASEHWIQRTEQDIINKVVSGQGEGHYYLLIGEKGTGKSSMLLEAMRKTDGEGASIFEAHSDPEVFRVRLGKALDFQYNEDYIGALFSIRGPRDTTALLDIERALDKLERVALRRRQRTGKPVVLIINSLHLLRNDDDGNDLVELLQHRAETWAAANVVTVVFNSDEYWVYERLKRYATRLEVIPVLDLPKAQALETIKNHRRLHFDEEVSPDVLNQVHNAVGGRLAFLSQVSKAEDMLKKCQEIHDAEKQWFLNQCWILGDFDDDVMDQQKYASAALLLAKALVDIDTELNGPDPLSSERKMPFIPLHKARELMTRADFIRKYEQRNFFKIDVNGMVRPDSITMLNAFREICLAPGFDEHLQTTLDRIDAVESLGRTRELVAKDLVLGGKYRMKQAKGETVVDLEGKKES
jgi:hypothetical protein